MRNKSHIRIVEGKMQKKKHFPINAELSEIINQYTKGMTDSDPLFKSYRTKQNIGRVQA